MEKMQAYILQNIGSDIVFNTSNIDQTISWLREGNCSLIKFYIHNVIFKKILSEIMKD